MTTDSQFLLEVSRYCSDEDRPAWADRLEQIANHLYTLERDQERAEARRRIEAASKRGG